MKILLKEIRENRKLTLRQMEILTGVSKSALSRIEKGEVALYLDVAEMIADGLHIGIDDLYESAVKHKKCPDIGTRQGKKRSGPFNH